MPDMIATVSTSVRKDELDAIDELSKTLDAKLKARPEGLTTTRSYGRAGILRAMLRFTLEHSEQFMDEVVLTDGQPIDDPDRTLGTDVTDTTSSTTTEEN